MADYRTIKPTIWSDPYFEELETHEKLLYIYLFSNPYINNAGVMKVSKRKIIFETYMSEEKYDSAIEKFQKDGKVMLFDEYLYVCKFIKHQTNTSPKMLTNIHKQLELTPCDIVSIINKQYPKLKIPDQYLKDTPPIPPEYPTDGLERELEGEREIEEEEEIPPYNPPLDDGSENKPEGGGLKPTLNDIEHIPLPECVDRSDWSRWFQYLKRKRIIFVYETAVLMLQDLKAWHAQGHDTAQLIEHAIKKNWVSLNLPNKGKGKNYSKTTTKEALQVIAEWEEEHVE